MFIASNDRIFPSSSGARCAGCRSAGAARHSIGKFYKHSAPDGARVDFIFVYGFCHQVTETQRFPSLSLRLRDSVANPSSELKNELIPNPDSNKNG